MLNTTFIKHAQKVIKSAKNRQVLQNIDVRDGYATVTDAHRLYRIVDKHTSVGTYSLDGALQDVNYPNTAQLVPCLDDAKYVFKADVREVYEFTNHVTPLHKALNDHSSTQEYVCLGLDTTTNTLRTSASDSNKFKAEMDLDMATCSDSTIGEVLVQGHFLKEAFHLLKDLGCAHAHIHIYSNMRPILIVSGDVEIILLPVKQH